tara:strand:+ start:1680 stop:2216 length:537 start_codon:yes stop_codon:yes gene_type:complete
MVKQNVNKYAKALYMLAQKDQRVNDIGKTIYQLHNCIQEIPMLNHLLFSQQVDKSKKIKIVNELFADFCDIDCIDLLALLIKDNNVSLFGEICKKYDFLRLSDSQEMNATITSSIELSKDELNVIIDKMSTKTGKKINLTTKVDSTLIGGIKLQTENFVIDNSMQYRLNKIKESLIKV